MYTNKTSTSIQIYHLKISDCDLIRDGASENKGIELISIVESSRKIMATINWYVKTL